MDLHPEFGQLVVSIERFDEGGVVFVDRQRGAFDAVAERLPEDSTSVGSMPRRKECSGRSASRHGELPA